MEYRFLGSTGLKVSRLCMGTMSFGGDADEATSQALFNRCRDVGINTFDCADVYNAGKAEQLLGQFVKECRDEVVLTTKAYFPTSTDVNARGSSRYHLIQAVEASLKRLQTDRIDVFFLHRFDDSTPLEETLRCLEQLVQQGKILYPAVSNFAAWQAAMALGVADCRGWSRLVCMQPMYNLLKRQAEVEILPLAKAEGIAVMPYSPVAGGLLSGKYGRSDRPAHGRIVDNKMYATRYGAKDNFDVAESFRDLAQRHGLHPVSLAVAWVASHPAVTAPLIGARNVEQLEASLAALRIDMSELRAEVTRLSPTPPPATDRNEESSQHNYGSR